MDKETLSNYGWIVILILILSVLLALATPFGNFIAGAIKATTAGFFSVNQNAMNAGVPGIHIPGQDFEDDTEDSSSGNTVLWIMSEDKYYVTATDALTMYNIDETSVNYVTTGVPDGYIPSTGDMYYTGEYVYRFNYVASPYREWWDEGTAQDMYGSVYPWQEDSWGAMVIDATKTSYSQIESVLFEYPVDNVCGTYAQTNIEDANVITLPDTVKYVTCAFYGCKNLKTIWSTVYVENWYYLYASCTNLKEVVIPAEVTTVGRIFSGCESLETIILEDGFSAPLREYAFWGCTSLKNIVIPTSCTSTYGGAFMGIWSLTDIYYRGNEEQWASFSVSGDSGGFKDATVHYNYTGE